MKPMIMLSLSAGGDLTSDPWDNVPTSDCVTFVKFAKSLRIRKGVQRREGIESLGEPISLPQDPPAFIEVDFPEEEEDVGEDEPVQRYNVVADNDIDVPEELLVETHELIAKHKDSFTDSLKVLASLVVGHEDASIFIETALRDGLGLDLEVDATVQEAFVPLSRLAVLSKAVEALDLPKCVTNTLLNKLANGFGSEMILAVTSKKRSDAIKQLHKMYAANIKKGGLEDDVPPDNTIGTRTSRL